MRSALRNVGVAARLTGGFAIVGVLIVILGYVALSGLFSVQRRYADAVRELSWARLATSTKAGVLEEVRAQKNYVIRGLDEYLPRVRQHAKEVDADLAELARAPLSSGDRLLVRTVDRQIRDLRESFDRAASVRREQGILAADALVRGKAEAAIVTLDAFAAAADARATVAANTAREQTHRTHTRTAALVIAVGAFAILLGLALSLSITRPVADLRRAVAAVADGRKPAQGPPPLFRDELASVSSAFHELVQRAALLQEMEARSKRLEALSARVVQAQEEERGRIARELHDGLGQALTAMKFELSAAAAAAGERDDDVADRLSSARKLTAETLEEIRRLARDLRPPSLDNIGLAAALRSYGRQCADWLPAEISVEDHHMRGRQPARKGT